MTMAQDRLVRKWEIFQGRNKFYCRGRCMTAPNAGVLIFTVIMITSTCTAFFIFDCKYLAQNVTVAIPIIAVLLFLFTMSALLRTSFTDPGIIPRATTEEAAYVEKQIEVTNSANSPTYRPPPRTKEVLIKGQTIKLKYCFTCKLFRPPRASHCSICDNCVDRFDHHCPWVGNCVGRRNYRFFYMFIVSLAFLAVFIFACSIAHLILMTRENKQFLDAVRDSPGSVICASICFFSVWSILGLAGFHTYLTTSNQTTNEDIKGLFNKRGQENFNPYSKGNVCLNCFHILCGPLTPSLIDRRGIVTDRYRREIFAPVISLEPPLTLANYGIKAQNSTNQYVNQHNNLQQELPGIYRQTTEAAESNAGSVTHLVASEHPLAIAPVLQKVTQEDSDGHYKSHPTLNNHSPVYNNITTSINHSNSLSKSQSFAENINLRIPSSSSAISTTVTDQQQQNETKESKLNFEDLHLDPVVLRENHILANINERTKYNELKLDNDLTLQEKENNLLSASRLKLLQDTTMIESALDLDSLEDSSVGTTNSQAGLMKMVV